MYLEAFFDSRYFYPGKTRYVRDAKWRKWTLVNTVTILSRWQLFLTNSRPFSTKGRSISFFFFSFFRHRLLPHASFDCNLENIEDSTHDIFHLLSWLLKHIWNRLTFKLTSEGITYLDSSYTYITYVILSRRGRCAWNNNSNQNPSTMFSEDSANYPSSLWYHDTGAAIFENDIWKISLVRPPLSYTFLKFLENLNNTLDLRDRVPSRGKNRLHWI